MSVLLFKIKDGKLRLSSILTSDHHTSTALPQNKSTETTYLKLLALQYIKHSSDTSGTGGRPMYGNYTIYHTNFKFVIKYYFGAYQCWFVAETRTINAHP